MKKIISLLLILLISLATISASTSLTFSGRYALVQENERRERRSNVDLKDTGIVMATSSEIASAKADDWAIVLGPNSMAALKTEEEIILYLVYGEVSLIVKKNNIPITVYTPVTLAETKNRGEYYFSSSNNEECVYNFSSSSLSLYDALRGNKLTIEKNTGFDYIKNMIISPNEAKRLVGREQWITPPQIFFTQELIEDVITVPATPVFDSNNAELEIEEATAIPSSPIFDSNFAELEETVPSTPTFDSTNIELEETAVAVPPRQIFDSTNIELEEEVVIKVPATPIFDSYSSFLENEEKVPSRPLFIENKQELSVETPKTPEVANINEVLIPSSPSFNLVVTQTLIDSDKN